MLAHRAGRGKGFVTPELLIAMSSAAVTSSARMWVAMLQPTTRRLKASVTAAR
jgi:hypothetical protein